MVKTSEFDGIVRNMVGNKGEVNVYWASKMEMERLGKKWLGDSAFHEVISFPLESEGILGEIVLWKEIKNSPEWVKHSCLHLLGIHHD